jgi:Flp pilus assembly pilin Flp
MILERGSRKSRKGQGLVEYAVIIALVAIVCVIILGLVGLAVTRNYGLIAGALGAKKDVKGAQNYVRFDLDTNPPKCGTILSGGHAGQRKFYAQFNSDFDFTNDNSFTAATDTGLIPLIITNHPPYGTDAWTINNTLNPDDPCPTSVVIQLPKSKGGGTAAYPVLHEDWP